MKQAFREALSIVLCAVVVAVAANYLRSDGIALVRTTDPGEMNHGDNVVSLIELLEAMRTPGLVILDARPHSDFEEGHIPGAKSLPEGRAMEQLPFVLQDLSFDRDIIVYCTGIECGSAEEVATMLRDMGYTNVKVYPRGWEEWEARQLPSESSF